jgi:hypothetical protein
VKLPAGTTIISGQLPHSLNVSFGFNACSASSDSTELAPGVGAKGAGVGVTAGDFGRTGTGAGATGFGGEIDVRGVKTKADKIIAPVIATPIKESITGVSIDCRPVDRGSTG